MAAITTREQCLEVLTQRCLIFNVPLSLAEEYTNDLAAQDFKVYGQPIQNIDGLFRRWLERVKGLAVAKNVSQRAAALARGQNPSSQQMRTMRDPEGYTFKRAAAYTNEPLNVGELCQMAMMGEAIK